MRFAHVACLLVLAWCSLAGAGAHFIPRPQMRHDPSSAMTLCGRYLAEARMLFCYEKGYAPKKKSYRPTMNDLSRYDDRSEEGQDLREDFLRTWPWMERHQANAFSLDGRGKRDGAGLVDECCHKPCTLDELLNYC